MLNQIQSLFCDDAITHFTILLFINQCDIYFTTFRSNDTAHNKKQNLMNIEIGYLIATIASLLQYI